MHSRQRILAAGSREDLAEQEAVVITGRQQYQAKGMGHMENSTVQSVQYGGLLRTGGRGEQVYWQCSMVLCELAE